MLSREKIDGWLQHLGASDKFDASKGIDWGVMPGPFYTPELGLGIGTAVVGMYRPYHQPELDPDAERLRQLHRRLRPQREKLRLFRQRPVARFCRRVDGQYAHLLLGAGFSRRG